MAIKYAAAAAIAPTSIVLSAPFNVFCPVTLLLKYPKAANASRVMIAEYLIPSCGCSVKKYALNGINPPTI
ncbi:MAG: hypothetical protein RLZZ94_132 [Bacteroidota bacterium]